MLDRMSRAQRSRSRTTLRTSALLALIAFSGCAQYQTTESGYLSDYKQLEKDPMHFNWAGGFQRAKTHYATSEDYREIDSFYIEPVKWMVDPESRAGKYTQNHDFLKGWLDKQIRRELSQLKPIVDVPGPKTATVRSAITTVRLSRPYANLLLSATYFSPIKVGAVFFGGAAMEAEVIGPDGRQIAAVTAASSGGLTDIIGFYTRTGHAVKALRRDAHELKQAILD